MRLRHIKPRIGGLAPVLRPRADAHGHDPDAEVQRWYRSAEWQELRVRVFERDGYECQLCGVLCVPKDPKVPPIGDHKTPHRNRRDLFFNEENVQTLCKPCHDGRKQREEARARREGGEGLT